MSLDSVDRRQRKWETERYMGKIKRDGNKRETFVNPLLSLEISTVFYQRWTALVDKKISEAIAEYYNSINHWIKLAWAGHFIQQ